MYTMQNLNVVKLVATESERDYLKSRGFKEVIAENKADNTGEEKKTAKKTTAKKQVLVMDEILEQLSIIENKI